jgi:hypothetical protein
LPIPFFTWSAGSGMVALIPRLRSRERIAALE